MTDSFMRRHSQPFVLHREGEPVGEISGVKSGESKVIHFGRGVEVFVGDWLEDVRARAWLHVTDATPGKLRSREFLRVSYETGLDYRRQEAASSQLVAMLDDIADAVWTLSDEKMPLQKKQGVRAAVREIQDALRSMPAGAAGGLAGQITDRLTGG